MPDEPWRENSLPEEEGGPMKDDDQVETIREDYHRGLLYDEKIPSKAIGFLLAVCNERRGRIIELEEEVSRLEDWSREEDGSDL